MSVLNSSVRKEDRMQWAGEGGSGLSLVRLTAPF